jgi:dihydroorotase
MPNLNPAPDSLQNLDIEEELIDNQAVIDVRPYATITKQRKGMEAVDFETLSPYVVGFSDDGSGVQNEAVMEEAMTHVAALKGIIAAHCEDNSLLNGGYIHEGKYAQLHHHRGICSESEWGQIKRDITLAEKTGCHYHVCHISTKESVELIRKAKARGVNITCETAPHYLVLTDEDLQEDGRFKMNPPLRSAEDQFALIEGIKDGTIDCIATDHAPHTPEEKSKGLEKSAMGIVGLETAFSVVYTHLVKKNVISFEKMLELMCDNPRRIFNL